MSDTQQVVDGWTVEDDIEATIKPCPRCGGKAILDGVLNDEIVCSSCGFWVGAFYDDIDEKIEWWNNQPLIDTLRAELATLRAQVQELQAWLDGSRNNEDIALDMLGKLNDIIATLRAQVQEVEAGQWVVASDGEYAVNGVIRLVVKGPTVEFWNKLQHLITIGMYSESVAICTRKPQEGAQPSDNYFETNEPRDNERWKDPEY